MNAPVAHMADFYKTGHLRQYPPNTTRVVSNLTPRSDRHSNLPDSDGGVVFFGLRYFIHDYLERQWDEFFHADKAEVLDTYQRRMDC